MTFDNVRTLIGSFQFTHYFIVLNFEQKQIGPSAKFVLASWPWKIS